MSPDPHGQDFVKVRRSDIEYVMAFMANYDIANPVRRRLGWALAERVSE